MLLRNVLFAVLLDASSKLTFPDRGGVLSKMNASEHDCETRPARFLAVTVTKYFTPDLKTKSVFVLLT